MSVSLDNQTFYNPAAATGRLPASRGPRADAILIPSDDEFDDLDGRSDTSFESLDELLLKARINVESGRAAGTGDESTSELEPADAEPRLQLQSPSGTAPGRGVDPQQRSGSYSLSQHPDHYDDNDLASDLERRHPLVPDDREQDEDNTPAPQDHRAASKWTSEKTTQQQSNLALVVEASPVKPAGILLTPGTRTARRKHVSFGHDAKQGPGATRASSTKWPDGERVSLQQNIGRRRQRQRCDTDEEEDRSPIVGSDAKRGKDGDVVQPSQGKRRKVNTAPKRQARLCTNSPPQQAQQGPKRRQSQRRASNPQSSGASALGEETPKAAFTSFEEWPLEAVLKRVWSGDREKRG
ncbi:hypothetical protein B0J18DRAFT_413371 [Chaetomium sp. MPI-SDFR-AT-0129]|nr:hypothetical protein B0J18DRAFT_413371 [Chaetomium sp. MPI-SDFR-AT-0129]